MRILRQFVIFLHYRRKIIRITFGSEWVELYPSLLIKWKRKCVHERQKIHTIVRAYNKEWKKRWVNEKLNVWSGKSISVGLLKRVKSKNRERGKE